MSHSDLTTGDRVRLFRRRAGLTQEEAAGLAGASLSLWRKWESGARPVSHFSQLLAIARTLHIRDLRDLTGQPFAVGPDGRPRHESIDSTRAALLRHPALRSHQPVDLEQFPRRVHEAWEAAQSASAFRYAIVGALLPDLIRDAEAALRDEQAGPRAVQQAVSVYLLARAFTKWVGEPELALVAAERCLNLAGQHDDPALLGAAAWNMAQALSTRGHAVDARGVAEDALSLIDQDAASFTASPQLLSAHGALHLIAMISAVRENEQRDAQHHITAAAADAARLGQDRNDFRLAFGPTNIAIHRVSYAVELGHSRTAISGASHVALSRSPSVERRASHWLAVAYSHALLREDVAALTALEQAEAESAEQVRYSVTARSAVSDMIRRETSETREQLRPLASRLGLLATA